MAEPDYQRPLLILRNAWRRRWNREYRQVHLPSFLTYQHFPGILARISHLLWYWVTPLGERRLEFSCGGNSHYDVYLRQPKMSKRAKMHSSNLFERIKNFFKRLETYTSVPPTDAMTDVIVKIMIEVLNIFAITTKEMGQGRASALISAILCRR